MKPINMMIVAIIISTMMVVAGGYRTTNNDYYTQDNFDKVIGNTQANILHGGLAMESNGWIYYSNYSDHGRLYKMRADGTNKVKLSDKGVSQINVVGEWIYCSAWDKNAYYTSIHKIKIDGSESILLSKKDHESIYITEKYIYFNEGEFGSLIRMNHEGKNEERVLKEYIFNYEYQLYKNWVYYIEYNADSLDNLWYLWKVSLDGSKAVNLKQKVSDFVIYDNWIYFLNITDDWKMYKMRIDGRDAIKVSDDKVDCFNIADNWIYYNNREDDSKIYKMRLDGTTKTIIADVTGEAFNIAGDWLFYARYGIDPDSYWRYRIKQDGTENQIVD